MRSNSIDSASVGSGSYSSGRRKAGRRHNKRSNGAMVNELAAPTATETVARLERSSEKKVGRQKPGDELDESFGLGCGFGCGRWRHDPNDPFGVRGYVRSMIQDRFSSRVDFSEEPDSRRYPTAVNFVEHRL